MSKAELTNALKANWYLVVIAIVFLGAVIVFAVGGGDEPPQEGPTDPGGGRQADTTATFGAAPPKPKTTAREQAEADLAEFKRKVDANPQGEETPGLLVSMANIYAKKLGNDKEAVQCYEKLLYAFPDWPGMQPIFPELEACYDRLKDTAMKRTVYERMLKYFPEGSPQHDYARAGLGYR